MGNSVNIKELWNKQAVPDIDPSDVFRKIKVFRRKGMKKIMLLNMILLLTLFFVLFIWVYFNPQLISTKIGIILTILPISIVIVFNHKIIPFYKRIDENQSNFDYLNDLLVVKSKQRFMQTKAMNFYFILLSAGICLYMYEYTLKVSLIFGIVAYSAILLWIGFNWFFLRPRIIGRNKQKMDYLIEQIRKVKSQLDELEEKEKADKSKNAILSASVP